MAPSLAEAWLSRFGDPDALSRRMEWDGLSAEDFAELPARLLRDLGRSARRAEAALRRRDPIAADAVLTALDRDAMQDAPLHRLLGLPPDIAALRSLAREASGAVGPVQMALGRVSLAHGIAALEEARQRLRRDAPALRQRFGFQADALRVMEAVGDPHANGRRVLRFQDADGCAVYLKPRPLDGERVLDRLALRLGAEGKGIRLPKMLARARYGWVAEARPAEATALRSAGALIAVADLAAAVDLHSENLMPAASGVSVLDGEMVLHPDLPLSLVPADAHAAALRLRSGVLRTGLLPEPDQPHDLCGLAAWSAAARMTREDAAEIGEGYAQALARLCAKGGARAALERALPARGAVRLLLRRSAGYGRLLERMRDPRATPHAQTLLLHLDALRIGMARGHRRKPILWGVAAAETAALLRGDIPRLWMTWDSGGVWEGDGHDAPCALLPSTPRSAALLRAAQFEADRAARQACVIRQAWRRGG